MKNAAGGTCNEETRGEAIASVITFGVGCAGRVIRSYINKKDRHVGQEDPDEGRLCNANKVPH